MIDLTPDAQEVLPRLWLGNELAARRAALLGGISILCVLESPTLPPEAERHIRILGDNGLVMHEAMGDAINWIHQMWFTRDTPALVHCAAGMERSPLTVMCYMRNRFGLSIDQAYDWLKRHRPEVADRRHWLPESLLA